MGQGLAGTSQTREEVGIGMLLHHFVDLGVKVANRLLGLLDLADQEAWLPSPRA